MSATVLDRLFASMQGSRGLPMLDHTATAVLTSVGSDRPDEATVVNHVIEDVALTQKVLKLANSSMYAPFASGADSVSSALKVLGSDALVHLVLGTTLIDDEELHEDENLSRSLLASELARNA